MSQELIDNIRRENYVLRIFQASNNNPVVSKITAELISFIQDIYRSLEPSHFDGHLVIYTTFDDSLKFDKEASSKLIDKSFLINENSKSLAIQFFQNATLTPLFWQNVDVAGLITSENAIIYSYCNLSECFYCNKVEIRVENPFDCASIYALQYHLLKEALLKYKTEKIRHSSCSIFKKCWADRNRIFFINGPEDQMQESLEQDLKSSLRKVDIVREYNLGASKPVDIRVYWKGANRAALLEIKWLGRSKNAKGKISAPYSDRRANEGAVQIKQYLDLERADTPTCITKGFLILIDGQRNQINKGTTTIGAINGMFHSNKEIVFDDDKKFSDVKNFENPIRMFAEPICF